MRTKSLIIAAAALVAGLVSVQAQNVYSQNIVGYANVQVKPGFNLMANPFDDGLGNNSTNLVPPNLAGGSRIYIYKAGTGYLSALKKATGAWGGNFVIPPGNGYFILCSNVVSLTNTYVGNVFGAVPGSVTNTFQGGYNLVGSPYPMGGGSTNVGPNTLNLPAALPGGSRIYVYSNGVGYLSALKKAGGVWGGNFPISVGQGFFIFNNTNIAIPWIQTIQ
jgi:hypothetical protein